MYTSTRFDTSGQPLAAKIFTRWTCAVYHHFKHIKRSPFHWIFCLNQVKNVPYFVTLLRSKSTKQTNEGNWITVDNYITVQKVIMDYNIVEVFRHSGFNIWNLSRLAFVVFKIQLVNSNMKRLVFIIPIDTRYSDIE
jgi:hypothetical protein